LENATTHAVGGSGVETVLPKEPMRGICSQDLPVKEHTDKICIFCAELHIVRDHNDGDSLLL
jgi:hypothetical protein